MKGVMRYPTKPERAEENRRLLGTTSSLCLLASTEAAPFVTHTDQRKREVGRLARRELTAS